MTLIIQILIILILLIVLSTCSIGFIYLLSLKQVKEAIQSVKKKQDAVVFDDEPKTEEEVAIEREERILKVVRGEK